MFDSKVIFYADIKYALQHVWRDQRDEYRFRRYIDELLQREGGNRFRLFALKQPMLPVSEENIGLQIRDLNRRATILG